MSKFWNETVKNLVPYVPGEQPKDKKYIKLNTNESPYPPSPKVIEAIKAAANEDLRLYPDPTCDELRSTIANYYGLKKEQVFIGNGSDELLAFCFMTFFSPKNPILFPDITYSFYPVYSQMFNINYEEIPLNSDFSMPVEGFCKKNGGVIICNPNAPTTLCLPLEKIKYVVDRNTESVVIVDEAYIDFGGESAVALLKDYPNLLVVKTLSKSRSLAGLRVGYALGNIELIEGLDRVKNSFNSYTIDRLALAGAAQAFKDVDYFEETRKKIIVTRERISDILKKMGFNVLDSKANFLFISHQSFYAGDLFKELRDRGILVRYFKKPRIDNFLRVTIGTDEEMDSFIAVLKEICRV